MKRVMLVNDLSGLGNCSMAANLSVFSALGIEGCPVPTAVLTNQSCYPSYKEMEYTPDFAAYSNCWEAAGVRLAAVYSGYFRTAGQIERFRQTVLEKNPYVPYFNDPVMGDSGTQYDNCSSGMVEAMRTLVGRAVLTTPNLTELCLLTGQPYQAFAKIEAEPDFLEQVAACAGTLLETGVQKVIVTGVKWKAEKLYNILVEKQGIRYLKSPLLEGDFSGTGDLFSSAVCGLLLQGRDTAEAVKATTDFLVKAIRHTGTLPEGNDGLQYQPFLISLAGG